MAKYLTLEDVSEDDLTIDEKHLTYADVQVDAALLSKRIKPLPEYESSPFLKEIAKLYAVQRAYVEQQSALNNTQDQFLFIEKAKALDEPLARLLGALSFDMLQDDINAASVTFELL